MSACGGALHTVRGNAVPLMGEALFMPVEGNRGRAEEPPLEVSGTVPRLVLLEPEEFSTLLVKGGPKPVSSPGGRDGVTRLKGGGDQHPEAAVAA
eukprot:2546708-Alexandrium_andersonii.AAC.1